MADEDQYQRRTREDEAYSDGYREGFEEALDDNRTGTLVCGIIIGIALCAAFVYLGDHWVRWFS